MAAEGRAGVQPVHLPPPLPGPHPPPGPHTLPPLEPRGKHPHQAHVTDQHEQWVRAMFGCIPVSLLDSVADPV